MNQVSLEPETEYAAKLTLIFGDEIKLDFLTSGIRFQDGEIEVKVFELLTSPTEKSKGWMRARVVVGPLPSMEAAQAAGQRISDALWSISVVQKISFSFEENSLGEIVEVVDFQRTRAMEARAELRSIWPMDGPTFTDLLSSHWQLAGAPLSKCDRISLGFYSSAEMEVSIEARFILLMTALESFCEQQTHSKDVKEALNKAVDSLVAALGPSNPHLASLSGQIRELRRESVAQSMKRILVPLLSPEEFEFVRTAYIYRSKLLHEGAAIPSIHQVNSSLRDILRLVYSKRFGWTLKYPIHPLLPL